MDAAPTSTWRLRDRSRHAASQALDTLREMILSLELSPGTLLSRTALQERFGLSSTPIRDALMRLQDEGLVEVFPQHATVVSPIDLGHARQAHFLRRALELEVVKSLAEADDKRFVPRVRATLAQQRAVLEVEDYPVFMQLDEAFHRQLCEAAGVPDLWVTVRSRSGHIDRLRRLHLPSPGKALAIERQHGEILDAIAAGDAALAQDRMREHLSGTLARIEEIRLRYPSYLRD